MKAKSSHGFSLVELMVALVISSILLGGVMTVMSSSKKTYTLQSELSALQDNARFLIDELTYKIRMAGYKGCSQQGELQNPFASPNQNSNFNGTPNSDRLIIVSFGEILPVSGGTSLGSTTITLGGGLILPPPLSALLGTQPPPDPLPTIRISACGIDQPREYTVTNATQDTNSGVITLVVAPPLDKFSNQQIEVFNGLQETIYQVQEDGTSNLAGLYKCQDNIPNGGCDDLNQLSTPFVEGVQSMQVRYGIKTGNSIQFNPQTTTQGDTVVAVRISLLMRTPKKRGIPGTTDKVFYLDPEVTYNPSGNLANEEGFRHRLFTTTIQVRNSTIN